MEWLLKILSMHKTILDEQIDVYLAWGERSGISASGYKWWLDLFRKNTKRTDVLDVTKEDVDFFEAIVQDETNGTAPLIQAKKALAGLMRFYMARSKNGKTRLGKGRPPAIEDYQRVGEYRTKNKLPFRQIGVLMGDMDVSQVHRFFKKFLDMKGKK